MPCLWHSGTPMRHPKRLCIFTLPARRAETGPPCGRGGRTGGRRTRGAPPAPAPPDRALLGEVPAADPGRGVPVHRRREQPEKLPRQGRFVVKEGRPVRFFGPINPSRLAPPDPAVGMDPPDFGSALVRDT